MATVLDFNTAAPQAAEGDALTWEERKERVKRAVEGQATTVVMHLWPAARTLGDDLVVGDISGRPGQSCRVRVKGGNVGVWSDFATGEKGADLIDLWQAVRRVDFKTAVAEMEAYLAVGSGSGRQAPTPPPAPPKAAKARQPGIPTQTWTYYDAEGKKPIATVTRYDSGDGKKEFLPWSVADGKRTHPTPRPLYNLPLIQDAPRVVLVEGEKCADALTEAGFTATTAMGGAKAPTDRTDWSPLIGKQVVIWPDNDQPGREYATAARTALEAVGCGVVVLDPPADKPTKWDAADAAAEGFDLDGFLTIKEMPTPPPGRLDLDAWDIGALDLDNPPPRQWLVDSVFPLGAVSMLAAAGDSGKGMLTLDLAAKVAGPPSFDHTAPVEAFGNRVAKHGTAVIFTAEDDQGEVHRRLSGIVGKDRVSGVVGRLKVVPLPNAGGPFALVAETRGGFSVTQDFLDIKARLAAVTDLALVVFDPMASFVAADINADPAAGAFVMGALASLATATGAAVIMVHHLGKGDFNKPIQGPEQARHMIRGSTAIVDGVRAAYSLWPAMEDYAREACKTLGCDWAPNAVFRGALVKSNGPGDRHVKTYLRDINGLLRVVDDRLEATRQHWDYKQLLELDIKRLAGLQRPASLSSNTHGLYARRNELSEELRDLGRDKLQGLAQALLDAERIQRVGTTTSKTRQWLDVPGGEFYEGRGELTPGFVEG